MAYTGSLLHRKALTWHDWHDRTLQCPSTKRVWLSRFTHRASPFAYDNAQFGFPFLPINKYAAASQKCSMAHPAALDAALLLTCYCPPSQRSASLQPATTHPPNPAAQPVTSCSASALQCLRPPQAATDCHHTAMLKLPLASCSPATLSSTHCTAMQLRH